MAQQEQAIPTIIEKYISIHALPNEPIVGWIKWDPNVKFDNMILRTEADIEMFQILNVDEELVKSNPDPHRGLFLIDHSWLEVDGFIAFSCRYARIPESTRKVNFYVDFIRDNTPVLGVELTTEIIVPKILLRNISTTELLITDYQEEFDFNIEIEQTGGVIVRNLSGFLDVIRGSGGIDVKMRPVEARGALAQNLSLNGAGFALLRFGFQYEDALGNKYKTVVAELTIDKRTKSHTDVPINSHMEGSSPLLTVST